MKEKEKEFSSEEREEIINSAKNRLKNSKRKIAIQGGRFGAYYSHVHARDDTYTIWEIKFNHNFQGWYKGEPKLIRSNQAESDLSSALKKNTNAYHILTNLYDVEGVPFKENLKENGL